MKDIILALQDIGKTFQSVRGQNIEAVRQINLKARKGEFLTLIGPSGCGKTTLLRLIAGLEAPSKGRIYLEGNVTQGINSKIGFIFQDFLLFPWRTVIENIEFALEVRMVDKPTRRQKAMNYINLVELDGFEDSYPKELSGGMKQRVAIARAVICNPTILLMDEPFASLDAQTRFSMQKFLLSLWEKEHKTIIFVTHNVDEAVFLGQRVVVISPGPGRITSDIEICLDYPRDIHSPEFIDIRRTAFEQLENDQSDQQVFEG